VVISGGAMKSFSIFLMGISLVAVSCERHEFEGPDGTKQLHEHHSAAGGEHQEHGTKHQEHGTKHEEHAEVEHSEHPEKKAEH
jgi:hypothetical protein